MLLTPAQMAFSMRLHMLQSGLSSAEVDAEMARLFPAESAAPEPVSAPSVPSTSGSSTVPKRKATKKTLAPPLEVCLPSFLSFSILY